MVMSSYYPTPSGYGCAPPPPQPQPQPFGVFPPYGAPYGAPASSQPYGAPASYQPYGAPCSPPPCDKPPKDKPHFYAPAPGCYPPSATYGSPFASLVPSTFPPRTDPNVVAAFQLADQDGSGFIDDKELQKDIFERFDRDRSGRIDSNELREALCSIGFAVSPVVLDLLVSKFDKSGRKDKAIEYDNFIECCLTVKGLTEKFREKNCSYSGSATFTFEAFMLTVLPFLIA
ncbi:hypothetical protein GH714_034846 [Hevea brasiliensis]|uniref:EF-hand domain-containing protein n=1 Tax=Hevea brasiliensis TaxID=3981 RepID=A0A6A6M437_HEVBR|nr:hypothetical protein GH714_034846 [Hevea brasiliensis]